MEEILRRLEIVDHLILLKKTGSPKELAKRFGVTERTLRKHINLLRRFGAKIKFSRQYNSYYYETEGSFAFRFHPLEK